MLFILLSFFDFYYIFINFYYIFIKIAPSSNNTMQIESSIYEKDLFSVCNGKEENSITIN